jgi:uncharacterized protein
LASGGYPAPVFSNDSEFYSTWILNYQNTYVNLDVAALFTKLNKFAFQCFIKMLNKLLGTIINNRDLGRALEVDEKTVKLYIEIANGTYV